MYFFYFSVNPWTGKNDNPGVFTTPKPFPWNRITVPKLLQLHSDENHNDYETFYTFLYILIAVAILILIYYCCKCCSSVTVYTNLAISPSHDHRRLANRPRATRCYNTNRSHLGRTFISDQRYERMLPEVHTASRIQRANMHNHCYNQEVRTEVDSSDKPPDYTSVVLGDCEKPPETPPPSYEENILNETNGILASRDIHYITDR